MRNVNKLFITKGHHKLVRKEVSQQLCEKNYMYLKEESRPNLFMSTPVIDICEKQINKRS